MFKFLRKYNKWILAVGGTLLLIVFLIPQAIQGLSQRAAAGAARRATVGDGEEVSVRDWVIVQEEIQFLDRIGAQIPGVGRLDQPEHWYLLVREAEEAGLIGGPASVAISQTQLDQIATGVGKRPSFILQTQAKLSGVGRLIALYQGAGKFSDRRLRNAARRLFHSVATQMVVLEADEADSDYEPTEAELQTQLDAFADVAPGEGDMGFGYRLPDRVKFEWMGIDADSVRRVVAESGEINGVELRRHWRLNENAAGYPKIESGAEVPEVVREGLLDELTEAKLNEIEQFAVRQLQSPRRGLEMRDGYLVLPDDWSSRRVSLSDLRAAIQAEYGIESPTYQALGDRWLSSPDLAELDPIGLATTIAFGAPTGLTQLVQAQLEFDGSPTILTQSGAAGPPLRGADGSIYLYRVTDSDASRPPASVDEVRDDLVRDLRRKDSYEALKTRLAEITSEAQGSGMVELALAHDTVVQPRTNVYLANTSLVQAQANAGFEPTALPSALPVIGLHDETVETIIDRALTLGADTNLSTLPNSETTFVLPVDDALSLLAVRLVSQAPLGKSLFTSLVNSSALERMLLAEELSGNEQLQEAFGYDALAARHQFIVAVGDRDVDDETGDPTAEPETPEG